MNRILTTYGASGQPFTSPTSLDHLQDAIYQGFKDTLRGLIGPTYDPTKAYAIWGCYYNPAGPSVSEGAIYFQDEIWTVDGWNPGFACGVGTVPVLGTVTTWAATDPLDYKDGSSHNTHRIRKIAAGCAASGSTDVCDAADLLRIELPKRTMEYATSITAASPVTVDFKQYSSYSYTGGIAAGGLTLAIDTTGALNGATAEVLISGGITSAAPVFFTGATPRFILTDTIIGAGVATVLFRLKYVKPSNTASEYVLIEMIQS